MPSSPLAPLFILWFGIGSRVQMGWCQQFVFFLIFLQHAAGVRGDGPVRFVANGARGGGVGAGAARHVCGERVPYVFAGLKISLSYAIGAAVRGELISSNRGLLSDPGGRTNDFDTTTVFAALTA